MVRLIDDLLDVSRISRGKFELKRELVQVQDVLDHAIETSQPLIEAGRHELIIQPPNEPVWLDGDLTRLAQVVSNLLNNSAKYTPNGGRITLSAGFEGDNAIIRVTDNGSRHLGRDAHPGVRDVHPGRSDPRPSPRRSRDRPLARQKARGDARRDHRG